MPKCILIADDSKTIRTLIRAFIENRAGFEVCGEAVDGVEAIEKAKELQPDLIILDLAMPRMNGAAAASVLKRRMPKIPIILFTMYDELMSDTFCGLSSFQAEWLARDGDTRSGPARLNVIPFVASGSLTVTDNAKSYKSKKNCLYVVHQTMR